ncbi:MAG: DUF4386 domain-containing protein [Chloroflexi bacterium]|nr:MAG: DUF4386 domain-containing protein [Chloroflexota bacterium]
MKTYRLNSVMAGSFYFLGTVMGILAIVVAGQFNAGEVSVNLGADPSRLTLGAFFIMLMGILLSAMTVFLYPLFRKDSEELAMGMVVFRGALEGAGYIIGAVMWVLLAALSKEFAGTDSASLQAVGNLVLEVSNKKGDIGTVFFIIGAVCLYTSFYRTRLIPRWLTIWGFIGAVPYVVYGVLSLFDIGGAGLGFLQLPLFFQELAMGLWLVMKGFNKAALEELLA